MKIENLRSSATDLEKLKDLLIEMVQINRPCLVYGNTGKSHFLKTIFPDIIMIDSREIIDLKSISGFYSIVNGDIKYVDGLLSKAMKDGKYICFKNVDLNPNLLQFLRPVINDGKLISSDGNTIIANSEFRLFFTSQESFELRNCSSIGPIYFTLNDALNLFKEFSRDIKKAFDFIISNHQEKCDEILDVKCTGVCLKESPECDCKDDDYICSTHFRMFVNLKNYIFSSESVSFDTNAGRMHIYQSFVNVFLKHESSKLQEHFLINTEPISLPNMNFAKTSAVEFVLKSLILNIKSKTPTLLVGETGSGKTAVIQYLSKHSQEFFGYKSELKVINMSSDFDGSDLIGGYRSMDLDKSIKDLYSRAKLSLPKGQGKKELLTNLLNKASSEFHTEIKSYLDILDKKIPFTFKEGILSDSMINGRWVLLDEINIAPVETLNLLEAILSKSEFVLYESGCNKPIKIHENFRLFACMNPYGDFGKKRYESKSFNKILMPDFSTQLKCIKAVVQSVTKNMVAEVDSISKFYFELKRLISSRNYTNIIEPLISGRTLTRALVLIMKLQESKDPLAIFNAFNLLFFTQLDLNSRAQALLLFKKHFNIVPPSNISTEVKDFNGFIVTPKVNIHMNDVQLAIKSDLPVLLQGDTSTGKTSLIMALAKIYSRKVVRINNHEHTEASDYIGNFITSQNGVTFKEGVLVSAMKKGYWVILDELNLAPSDVLEVLNRLLDDNKEIYIPETEETVKPHPNFRIFATQNINYAGRQGLAKSLRNRFVEIFFYEKDETEIKTILGMRCKLPPNFISLMMSVYSRLRLERTLNSLITLRDLFKWAKRGPVGYYHLYEIGLDILLERQRSAEDRNAILTVFNQIFSERMAFEKREYPSLYKEWIKDYEFAKFDLNSTKSDSKQLICIDKNFNEITNGLVLTKSYIKLIDSIYKAWNNKEPVLLIGETGIGKTKICEVVAKLFKNNIRIINMHNGTEGSDFIGHSILNNGNITWIDGIVLRTMKAGECLLIDEVNLAEDSVLERLNSLLEDKRTIFVPETGEECTASEQFRIVATMNPSGDFGKRELSPALRSRFTEIYFALEPEEFTEIFDKLISRLGFNDYEVNYFKAKFEELKTILSIRKLELIFNHLENIKNNVYNNFNENMPGNNNFNQRNNSENSVYFVEQLQSPEMIWQDVLELLGVESRKNQKLISGKDFMGVKPYYLYKKIQNVPFYFDSSTACLNLKRIIRGLTLGRGILLEGDPGIGKTSIIQNIAKIVNIPVLRINLSDQTEMSDLVGAYLPRGNSIDFVQSQFIEYLIKGYWVILDEINLCTQSVIEGLNSLLDYRREILVNECVVKAHPNSFIFGTMNPSTSNNGRKSLPKSFLDRFIRISMDSYSMEDIKQILLKKYGEFYEFDSSLSLRGNIKINELKHGFNFKTPLICEFKEVNQLVQTESNISNERISLNQLARSDNSIVYNVDDTTFNIGSISLKYKHLDDSYVIIHSQIAQIEKILKCIIKKIPVILSGKYGKYSLLNFLSKLLGLQLTVIDCHSATDTCDLLGQYVKTESKNNFFEWKDSPFVSALSQPSLISLNTPECIEKSIFDRLNSVFESERSLNIFEKGYDSKVNVNEQCVFFLCCDNPHLLSPALYDRCVCIELDSTYSYIDLYKIFSVAISSKNDQIFSPKKYRIENSEILMNSIENFLTLPGYNNVNDLDLDVRKAHYLMKLPDYLNMRLPIVNAIKEHDIEKLFSVTSRDIIPYDSNVLDAYRVVSSFSLRLPNTYKEKIENFRKSQNIIAIIKNVDFDALLTEQNLNCVNFPDNFTKYKEHFISCLKSKKISDISDLNYFSKNIQPQIQLQKVDFNTSLFKFILGSEDPLITIRKSVENDRNAKEYQLLQKIADVLKAIYKYGTECQVKINSKGLDMSLISVLNQLVKEYDSILKDYNKMLFEIDKKLNRNYKKFLEVIENITFCCYCKSVDLRLFLEDFNDIFDYYLIFLFSKRNECLSCRPKLQYTTKDLSLLMLRDGFYTKCMKPEYSKYLYNMLMNKKLSKKGLILEALCFEEPLNSDQISSLLEYKKNTRKSYDFTEEELNECILSLIPEKTDVHVIETRCSEICIGTDINPTNLLSSFSIFSTPEFLINKIQEFLIENETKLQVLLSENSKTDLENSLYEEIKANQALFEKMSEFYKRKSCLEIDRNYRYFQYFIYTPHSIPIMENFFLNANVYEFLDRFYFAMEYLKFNHSLNLYNIVLQYAAFEVDKLHNEKLNSCKAKLTKEPSRYHEIISQYVDKFMYIPITSVIEIKFDPPACQKIHNFGGPNYLLKGAVDLPNNEENLKESNCECAKWLDLSRKFNRENINHSLSKSLTKEALISKFMVHIPEEQFSYSEICLAKVLNKIINNLNKNYYDETSLISVLKLLELSIDYPFPPFLYFVYKFSDLENEGELEDGVAIKGGQGENNMKDKNIKEEDIADEYDNNDRDNSESDGIDMKNDGELHSVSDENEGSDGVDENDNSGEKEDDDQVERGQKESSSSADEGDEIKKEENITEIQELEDENEMLEEEEANDEETEICSEGEESTSVNDNLEDDSQDQEDSNNQYDTMEYSWNEAKLNKNQTCSSADGYNRKVEGGNLEEKDALKEGDGEEFVEGEGAVGKGVACEKVVEFTNASFDYSKLLNLLRTILESNKNSKYKGDYKSGKKLNLKKIIPYIASDFKKDKIWMKRQRNDKKDYILRIFIDNSKSMFDQTLIDILSGIYYKISQSFAALNIPTRLYKFGKSVEECTIKDLTFTDEFTHINWTDEFNDGINIILTDGVFQNVGYFKDNFLVVMIDKGNVRKMSKVAVIDNKVFVEKYLDTFTLRYCIVESIDDLERVFIESLSALLKNIN